MDRGLVVDRDGVVHLVVDRDVVVHLVVDQGVVVHLVVDRDGVVHLVVVGTVVNRGLVGGMVDQCVVGFVRQINPSGLRLVLCVF